MLAGHNIIGAVLAVGAIALPHTVAAQRADTSARIENQIAVFAALDKVTARISKLEVPLGETVKFGALKVTPRTCFSRQPTEPPKTTTFVEVTEIQLDGAEKSIFAGWMFAESPGLNAVEHPVFDVWLTDCIKPKTGTAAVTAARPGAASTATKAGVPGAVGAPPQGAGPAQQPAATDPDFKRRRPAR
jgi:hypothetical protein